MDRRVALDWLDEIPGVGRAPARVVIAEIGLDMGRFPTPAHLCSWARFAPGSVNPRARRRAPALPVALARVLAPVTAFDQRVPVAVGGPGPTTRLRELGLDQLVHQLVARVKRTEPLPRRRRAEPDGPLPQA